MEAISTARQHKITFLKDKDVLFLLTDHSSIIPAYKMKLKIFTNDNIA